MGDHYQHRGKVLFYKPDRRFGFVRLDTGDEAFFHKSAFARNITPKKDDRVLCDVEPNGDRGFKIPRMIFE